MTRTTLSGLKIALMVADGFDANQFSELQKMLLAQNASLKVISPKSGLVYGDDGGRASMSYSVDAPFSQVLSVDYDALVIPSGKVHIEQLKHELHTTRIIRAFMRADMPVLTQGRASYLVAEIDTDIDPTQLEASGANWQKDNLLWVSEDCNMGIIQRQFVAICVTQDEKKAQNKDSNVAA